jgi:hypothetical protein
MSGAAATLTKAVVEEAERHQRRQPQQHHQLRAVSADVVIYSLELRVS